MTKIVMVCYLMFKNFYAMYMRRNTHYAAFKHPLLKFSTTRNQLPIQSYLYSK
jgi:hypothetical protein